MTKIDRSLFDTADARADKQADARAEADLRAGRTISHGAVKRWITEWAAGKRLPRPRSGD